MFRKMWLLNLNVVMRNIIFNLQKLENFTALLLLVFIFSWYFNTEMPSIESKMIEEGLKEFFLFIIQEEKCMEWKQFYSLLWWQCGRELLEEGRIRFLSIFKGIEYMGCNDSLEIKHFRKLWSISFMQQSNCP